VILLLALFAGFLYAGGLYMMMRRSMGKLLIGLVLLSHGANLLIFVSGNLARAHPPLLPMQREPAADPLPQALVLTAIVIGFGVLAFALALVRRAYEVLGTDDLHEMRSTDQ
jgi:multicomponent Na+:H+ antiporter subunit C